MAYKMTTWRRNRKDGRRTADGDREGRKCRNHRSTSDPHKTLPPQTIRVPGRRWPRSPRWTGGRSRSSGRLWRGTSKKSKKDRAVKGLGALGFGFWCLGFMSQGFGGVAWPAVVLLLQLHQIQLFPEPALRNALSHLTCESPV